MARQRVTTDELLHIAQNSILARYLESIQPDSQSLVRLLTTRLNETLRINLRRNDSEWTKRIIEDMGGVRIAWLPNILAYTLPFERGHPPNDETKTMLRHLHESGRITRQEAVSMIPTESFDFETESCVLDMCASPGSKSTQLAEHLFPSGVVVANEPSSGRLNTLSSNRARLGLYNMMITKHDGRHFPAIPQPGFDAILVDAPCTGSATTRKNPEVWAAWSPADGRSMFKLQLDILKRAFSLLKPGGELVYSTCSIDPVENEAVVAQMLREHQDLHLDVGLNERYPQAKFSEGMAQWKLMEDSCHSECSVDEWLQLRYANKDMLPPEYQDANERETYIRKHLNYCIRVNPLTHDTGGFFVAKFIKSNGDDIVHEVKKQIQPRDADEFLPHTELPHNGQHQISFASESLWKRGKRLILTPAVVTKKLHLPPSINSKQAIYPKNTFAPLRLIHLGSPIYVEKKNVWRMRHEFVLQFPDRFMQEAYVLDNMSLKILLEEGSLDLESTPSNLMNAPKGPLLLASKTDNHTIFVSAWLGAKVTPMVGRAESSILKLQLESIEGDD